MSKYLKSHLVSSLVLLLVISGLIYLPFAPKFGYYKDDWYLMYAAGARGALVFREIFSIDRPGRSLVMIPTYILFGPNPLFYNIAAYSYRLIGALGFFWTLCLLWPRHRFANLSAALLFLIYPGFLSMPNAIDYQSHLSGLAAGMISIALTLKALTAEHIWRKALLWSASILLGLFYLSQIEWYIGLEVFRCACILSLFRQQQAGIWKAALITLLKGWPALLISAGFLIWRIFFFESIRGATDVNLQLDGFLSSPFNSIAAWLSALWNDVLDSLFRAWITPFRRLSFSLSRYELLPGLGLALLVFVVWMIFQSWQRPGEAEPSERSSRTRDAVLLGILLIVFGLLPVIVVGRGVDFKNFSRYTLIASAGVALLWQIAISIIPNRLLRNTALGILLVSASLTHYVNGLVHVHQAEAMNRFWWQVSWRIPQMKQGVTLVAHYPGITIEEDYFVWGPANLIYYPESMHPDYPQPSIYAVLMSQETVEKVAARKRQELSNRRGIHTYPNYRNILILTQPSLNSCVQVIDGMQTEFSSYEDKRIIQMGSFSEIEHILLDEAFQQPPQIPFGSEPEHTWCYYYEKAAFARQLGRWDEVAHLGDEAMAKGFAPQDEIEWMPFLQSYAISRNLSRLKEIDSQLTDSAVREQACRILQQTQPLSAEAREATSRLFCSGL